MKALFLQVKESYEKNLDKEDIHIQFIDICDELTAHYQAKILDDSLELKLANDQVKFIFEELIPGVSKRSVQTTTKNMRFQTLISKLITSVTKLFNSMLQVDGSHISERLGDMADAMRLVFDPQQKFY